jgi:hypothetical protein
MICVRGCEGVFVKRFVIRTQSRVRSVIGVSQRGGVIVVCVEVSGKKVEGVVLARYKNAQSVQNLLGILRDSACF